MATRSFIATVDQEYPITYKGVYCHFDGSPTSGGVGSILDIHYISAEAVELLVSGGDMSSLAETPELTEYYTKRGEPLRVSTQIPSSDIVVHARGMGCEYLYVYNKEKHFWTWYKLV